MCCPICHNITLNIIGNKNGYDLVKCSDCSCIYVYPFPTNHQIKEMYDGYLATEKYLKKLNKKILTSRYKIFRLKKHQKSQGNAFLDVGCNIGATVRAAQISNYSATGIDLDKVAINNAQNLFKDCEFHVCSSFDLITQGKKFDFIYCSEVIEHVPDTHSFMQSLADLMHVGGILYLTTPDAGHTKVPKNFVEWKEVKPPEHIVFFNKHNMHSLLQEHGFKIIKFFWNHRTNLRVVCRKIQAE